MKHPAVFGDELRSSRGFPRQRIEQRLQLRFAGKRSPIEVELTLDQLDQLGAIFVFGRADPHRASLASSQ